MTNVPFERIEEFRDIESLNHFAEAVTQLGREPAVVLDGLRQASRDNARTPVQWSAEPNAGFTTGEPWIAVHPNHSRINAIAQRGVAGSVFEYYRALIALRHNEAVVVHGAFELLEPQHPALFAYTRTLGDEVLLVVANLSSQPQVLPPALALDGPVLLANYPAGPRTTMRPWEAWVTRR